jgi:hypothetical protein
MSYSNFGFKSNVRSTVSPSSSTPKPIEPNVIEVRVIKSIITKSDAESSNLPVGSIMGESTDANNIGKVFIANPLNSNITNIPIVGELVDLYKSSSPNSIGKQWLYGQPKGAYGTTSVNSNAVSPKLSPNPTTTSSTLKNYQAATLGIPVSQPTTQTSSPAKSIDDPKISSLESNPGDIIYEGRHGQSLRLGNTEKNPIIILRNGQNPNSAFEPGIQLRENIQGDMSSLYLTSNQKLSFSLTNENFNAYDTPPITPSSFILSQAILNSDRVVLNARKDSILISGNQSVGISSNDSINIESKQLVIDSPNIKIGSKDASQSALKGDDTVQLLRILIQEVANLTTALKTSQIYPSGIPTPDPIMNPVAEMASSNLNKLLAQLDGIKSNFVKII